MEGIRLRRVYLWEQREGLSGFERFERDFPKEGAALRNKIEKIPEYYEILVVFFTSSKKTSFVYSILPRDIEKYLYWREAPFGDDWFLPNDAWIKNEL